MKSKLSLLAFILFVTAGVAVGLTSTPTQADAGQCLSCSLGSPSTTPVVTVTDVDCIWSEMKARNQLRASVGDCNPHGYCTQQFITTQACHYVGYNQWRVSMKMRYQCKECIDEIDF